MLPKVGFSSALRCTLPAVAITALLGAASDAWGDVQPHAGMLRNPDVGATHIVFQYAHNLWLVPRAGGLASPVTSATGPELHARFSPDSQTLAFSADYGSGRDLYTLPVTGGIPSRLTHHPGAESLCDWTPDGKLLFATNAQAGLARMLQLFTVSAKAPLPTQLPVAYGSYGAISPDGVWLAYTPYSRDTRTWKRYRGGMASDIWLFHLPKKTAQRITDWEGTDTLPMWHEQTVYYLCDAGEEARLNIWSYDTATGERRQITRFSQYDVKWPAIGPGADGQGEIVFQCGADLYLLDLDSGESRRVEVTIPGDRPQIMPQLVDVSRHIESADIAPQGQRIVIEARGDLWSLPVEHGSPRNMTRSSGVAERHPSWSPDGKWIAYFTDLTGEYELTIKQSDGKGDTRRLTQDGQTYRYSPTWSGDSKHIAFTDKSGTIYLHTIASGTTRRVDQDARAGRPTLSWSHDSSWLAYDKTDQDRGNISSIWLYEVATGKSHQVTDDMFNDTAPAFDRKGEYLYFASNRQFGSPIYEDLGTTFVYANTEILVAMPLRKDVKNPLLPKSDEVPFTAQQEEPAKTDDAQKKQDAGQEAQAQEAEKKADKEEDQDKEEDKEGDQDKEADKEDEKDKDKEKEKEKEKEEQQEEEEEEEKDKEKEKEKEAEPAKSPEQKAEPAKSPEQEHSAGDKPAEQPSLRIELEGLLRRSFRIPVRNGQFSGLAVNQRGQLLYVRRGPRGTEDRPSIQLVDLSTGKANESTVLDGAQAFSLSADGKKLLVMLGRSLAVLDAAAGQKPTTVSTAGMSTTIDPRAEWKQIFVEAWRIERDFFYDPHMHGVDWPAVRAHYERLLSDCASRDDVGYVISEMISELNVGHAYYRPPGEESDSRERDGVWSCQLARKNGAYQIASLYEGAEWDLDARNPLRQAGISEGEYLLAVNHVPLDMRSDPWSALQGLGGRSVVLTVSKQPKSGGEDRDVVVTLPTDDSELRYRQWIEHNRHYVHQKSGGKVGYIYVPDTGINGQNDLFRQFFGQIGKEALIIDDRWNGGGQIPTRFIELLNRPVTNYWAKRDGLDMTWPPDAHQGPKCMLINGLAGSGGDMFPALFRQLGLGQLIGTRTWGGLVGISGNPGMIDGSSVTAPTFAYYEKDGTWGIEGHGVDPDIEVVDDPARLARGVDPQLDAAVKLMLEELQQRPYTPPARPPYPDRKGMGIKAEDK